MADLGAFFGNPNLQRQGARARALAAQRDVNTLADPLTYAAVQGLLGTRPDEMGFSVLNPNYEKIKKVAEPAFALGLLGQASPMLAPLTKGLPVGASIKNVAKVDQLTGLPLNADGTVTVYHHTSKKAADQITSSKKLKSAGEPDVYVTTEKEPNTGYGETVVPIRINPEKLILDDEFPSGRMDFRIPSGKSGVSIKLEPKVAPRQEALDLAQQRAALPVSEGGLGLRANNTATERADAMFPYDVYHGTNADIEVMNTAGKGKTSGAGAFVNDNPLVSETYINAQGGGNIIPMRMSKEGLLSVNAKGRNWADIDTNTLAPKAGKKRYSLEEMELDKNSATSTDELGIIAKDILGLKGVEIKNVKDLGPNSHIFRAKEYLANKYGIVPDETWSNVSGDQFAEAKDYMDKLYKSQKSTVTSIQDPDLLRSRFAAYDPFRRDTKTALARGVEPPDLLAGVLPLGLLADEEQRKKLYELMPSLLGE